MTQASACRSDACQLCDFICSILQSHGAAKWRPTRDGWVRYQSVSRHGVNAIRVLLGLHQLVADGITDDCSGRSDVELAHRRRAVCFDRLDAEIENLSHFPVAVTFCDQLNDHAFRR